MFRKMAKIGFFAFLVFYIGLCAADTLSTIKEKHAIVIAHRENSIPFSYLDTDKHPIGYAIDVCKKVAESIAGKLKIQHIDVKYLLINPATRIDAIVNGDADIECGSTSNTDERRKRVDFALPHFFTTARVLVRANANLNNWPDLHDKTIVTTKGTTNAQTLIDRDKIRSLNIHLIEARDHGEAFHMVETKKADAFAMDDVLLYGLRANAPHPDDFRIIGDPLSVEPYSIMLRKNDLAFKHMVDMAIVELIDSGEIFKIYEKWFLKPIPPLGINMNMPMSHLLRESLRFPSENNDN